MKNLLFCLTLLGTSIALSGCGGCNKKETKVVEIQTSEPLKEVTGLQDESLVVKEKQTTIVEK